MSRLIDLSHTIEHGMRTYKGLPPPAISDHLSRESSRVHYAEGTEFQIGRIEMVANTGTYIDSPFHRYPNAPDISEFALEAIADLHCVVLRPLDQPRIDHFGFAIAKLKGCAVLFHTGWDEHWRTERYFTGHPYLTARVAQQLVDAQAALVGIDSYNIDSTEDKTRPVHSALLRAGIPIVEHLCNLSSLPDEGARFFAVPVKVKGMGSFPVRAFAQF
ncbi:MAG: cyclase family protein [Verrucomicrobia bacterium]|nr:cyclase family protein [Verrucomicrobiota bacterium]